MNIKSIKTRQFAGVKNKEVTLDDGLNVLVGNNEAGKSTMIELIYQTLYRDSKLNATKKEDKDFFARFMPSNSKGDVVDGTLVFTTAEGEYTLQKKWGANAGCELAEPDGTIIANEDKIREIIAGELIYKKGLYDDVVFTSQKSQENVVEHILNKLDKKALAKQDLVSIIASEGMTSTGGIAPEDIENIINDKIDGFSGNWDFEINLPKNRRGIDNPYTRGNGSIIEAHYKLEELKNQLNKSVITEKAIDNDNTKILEAKEKLNFYEAEKDEYECYAEVLATYKNSKKLKDEYLKKQEKISKDIEAYPELLKTYREALHLSNLAEADTVINHFEKIQEAKKKLDEAKKALEGKTEISAEDEKNLVDLDREIDKLQAKLSNLDLVANIKKLGNTDIQVKSVATGKIVDINSGEFDIDETVEIIVPGIMSMTIAAKGVDVEDVQNQLARMIEERASLLSKCKVKNLEDLRTQKDDYANASRDFDAVQKKYDELIEGVDINKLEDDYSHFKDNADELEGLADKIKDLCGPESIDKFVAKQEQILQFLEEEYDKENPLDSMNEKLLYVEKELEKLVSVEDHAAKIPEKYLEIEDVSAYKEGLKTNINNANKQIKENENLLHEHEKELGDVDSDDLRARIDDAEIEFQKNMDNWNRWNHILTVLKTTRDNMAGESTMSDVSDKFAEYLSVITDGRIALKSMDENMDVNIQSGDNHMTYEILSEGTKDTIALAFRLAMLEHLFPDGGGLVIFDDPFTEMDESRTKQACKLVQKFADDGNQVLFVTCDNKYKNLLSGNTIEM